jgi:hypothetical protein
MLCLFTCVKHLPITRRIYDIPRVKPDGKIHHHKISLTLQNMALSNKRKLHLLEARRKAAEAIDAKKRQRLEEDIEHSELEDSSDDSSSSDSDTVDEENITDSDDDTPAVAANSSAPLPKSDITLRWNNEAGKNIPGMRGTGSRSTEKRVRRHQLELAKAASQSYSIVGLFERQRSLGLSMGAEDGTRAVPLKDIEHGKAKTSVTASRTKEDAPHEAIQDLKRLLRLKGEQKRTYGKLLIPGKDFHRRHLMVESFLMLQERKHEFQDCSRRELAAIVAKNYGRGAHSGLKIVRWERSWIEHRTIPESKAGKHRHNISWMDDEEVLLALQQFVKSQGEGQFEKVFTALT